MGQQKIPAGRVSMFEKHVDGVPVLMTEFGYKTFTMVVKAIGYLTKKTSPTYLKTSGVMEKLYGQPLVLPEYPMPSADYIMKLYTGLLADCSRALVVGPGLETCCYLGRALNAPVLPSQFIASAPDRRWVEANGSAENLYVVGHETDWPELCVWVKPTDLGKLYGPLIEQAEAVVIFQHDSGEAGRWKHGTWARFDKGNITILDPDYTEKHGWMQSAVRAEFVKRIQNPAAAGYREEKATIPHWEFSMAPEQVDNLVGYLRRRGKRAVVVSSGDWHGMISARLFAEFYRLNGIRPTGITLNNYWVCHPFYESEFGRIPAVDFQYGAPAYVAEFKRIIDTLDFEQRVGEYIVWPGDYKDIKGLDPRQVFESWGFETVYHSQRPYDVWHWRWERQEDLRNPTRQWIVPQLKKRKTYRTFRRYLSVEQVVACIADVPKTTVRQIT